MKEQTKRMIEFVKEELSKVRSSPPKAGLDMYDEEKFSKDEMLCLDALWAIKELEKEIVRLAGPTVTGRDLNALGLDKRPHERSPA